MWRSWLYERSVPSSSDVEGGSHFPGVGSQRFWSAMLVGDMNPLVLFPKTCVPIHVLGLMHVSCDPLWMWLNSWSVTYFLIHPFNLYFSHLRKELPQSSSKLSSHLRPNIGSQCSESAMFVGGWIKISSLTLFFQNKISSITPNIQMKSALYTTENQFCLTLTWNFLSVLLNLLFEAS